MADKQEVDTRESAEITLKFPFDFDGERVESVTIRRAKVRDKIKASRAKGSEAEKGMTLLANLIERPVEFFDEMDEYDLEKVQDQYLAFTGRTPETD